MIIVHAKLYFNRTACKSPTNPLMSSAFELVVDGISNPDPVFFIEIYPSLERDSHIALYSLILFFSLSRLFFRLQNNILENLFTDFSAIPGYSAFPTIKNSRDNKISCPDEIAVIGALSVWYIISLRNCSKSHHFLINSHISNIVLDKHYLSQQHGCPLYTPSHLSHVPFSPLT